MEPATEITPPRQARSIATMHRILDAAETLMEHASFENIPMQAIMTRASVSPGSFYARFPDKATVLAVLYDRYASDIETIVDEELPQLAGLDAERRLRAIIGLVGRTYSARRGVARSVALHYWNSAEETDLIKGLTARQAALMKRISAAFSAAVEELGGGGDASAMFALKMVLMASREHYLFSHKVKTLRISDAGFEASLSEMVIGYLRGSRR